jgi:hypothetical protein
MIIIGIGRSRSVIFESGSNEACWTAVQQGCDGDRATVGWKHNSACGGVGEHLVECVLCNSGQRDGVLVERVLVGRYCVCMEG